MQDLFSPHNDEQCVCADVNALENASLKDCAHMFKQFAADLDNIHKYMRAAGREAIETTLKHRDAQTAYDVEKCVNRFVLEFEAMVLEFTADIDENIVIADRHKCPYCNK
jgi:thiamine pyrophosphokinase